MQEYEFEVVENDAGWMVLDLLKWDGRQAVTVEPWKKDGPHPDKSAAQARMKKLVDEQHRRLAGKP